jgi:PAS domain S-box-containing protein
MLTALSNDVLEYIENIIVILNQNGEAEYVNAAVNKILGYKPTDLLGNAWWTKIRASINNPYALKKEFLEQLKLSEKTNNSFERVMIDANGNKRYILWNVVKNEQDKYIGIGQDITKQKEMELKTVKQQKEILDSIEYARNLQEAILPDLTLLDNVLYDYFVLYKPKDILSGDFYWTYKKENILFVAAIDCTGHGVPGAMMSVLANSILRDVIIKKQYDNLIEIFNELDKELIYALSKQSTRSVKNDGMDLGLLKLNFDTLQAEYIGANRPLLRVTAKDSLQEYKGNPFPIGYFYGYDKNFSVYSFSFNVGECFYLFSDGFPDQFGGERNKKFSKRKFKELLLSLYDMNMDEQKAFLEYVLNNWKQDEPQTDDILVFGLKV